LPSDYSKSNFSPFSGLNIVWKTTFSKNTPSKVRFWANFALLTLKSGVFLQKRQN